MNRWPGTSFYRGAALAIFSLLALVHWGFGELNQDEGWYLYAARQSAEGREPYADFAFTQGPLLPRVYALAQPLLRRGGVGAGRALTALFGLAAVAFSALLASRWAPRGAEPWAGAAAALLIGVNVYQSYFFTVVKTYSLCAVLLIAGFLALSRARGPRGAVWAFVAGVLMAAGRMPSRPGPSRWAGRWRRRRYSGPPGGSRAKD